MEACDLRRAPIKVQTNSPQNRNLILWHKYGHCKIPIRLGTWVPAPFFDFRWYGHEGTASERRLLASERRLLASGPDASGDICWLHLFLEKNRDLGEETVWTWMPSCFYLHPFMDCECEECGVVTKGYRKCHMIHSLHHIQCWKGCWGNFGQNGHENLVSGNLCLAKG